MSLSGGIAKFTLPPSTNRPRMIIPRPFARILGRYQVLRVISGPLVFTHKHRIWEISRVVPGTSNLCMLLLAGHPLILSGFKQSDDINVEKHGYTISTCTNVHDKLNQLREFKQVGVTLSTLKLISTKRGTQTRQEDHPKQGLSPIHRWRHLGSQNPQIVVHRKKIR